MEFCILAVDRLRGSLASTISPAGFFLSFIDC